MKLSQSVKPISYLKAHASEIIKNINQNQSTMVITQRGEAKVVVQDLISYEQTQESLALLKLLAGSTLHLTKGKVKPAKKVFQDLRERVSAL